ncbi:MAG: ABC transporter ATP-binding protein [Coprococcus sp.]
MNVIEIEHLTYSYPGADQPTLKDITIQIEKGDFLAIVGNNGCGKSTFCKTLNGLIPQFISGDFEGKVLACGLDTNKTDVGVLAQKVGYVYQDFENQIIRPTVLDDASYACLNYAMPDYKERGMKALEQCGLTGKEDDYIWQLSGGQTHLLALAGAVSLQPDVLILDEPIAQLDPAHADRIYGVLRELNEKYGKTIIVIEHHTEYIADYCRHVMLMKDGRIQWMLPTDEALRRVGELQECNIFPPQVTIAAHRLQKAGLFAKNTVLPTTVEEGRAVFALKADSLTGRTVSGVCPEPEAGGRMTSAVYRDETVAQFRNVSVSYRSVKGEPHSVFSGLNLEIHKGDKVALIGSNGAGKSTLMKMLVGLLKPSSGEIFLNGESIRAVKPETLSRQISMVYQNPEDMFIKDSIGADIAYAMEVRNIVGSRQRTDELLERFRLTELRDRDGRLLSGGQMRRASLAIGIALNPGILLLDEPTANLDIATRKEIMRTLEDLKSITETVIIATHDMQLVCEWADRIIVLCGGQVVGDGSRDEIFGNRSIVEKVGIRPPEIFTMGQVLCPDALCYTIDDFLNYFEGRK